MAYQSVLKFRSYGVTLLLTLAWVGVALAGGFQLAVEMLNSTNDPQLREAALLVRPYGCHQPANAVLSATAEGLVDGQRRSLPLQLTPSSTGVYVIKQQWPSKGVWALAITGRYNGLTSSALVELGPGGKVQGERPFGTNNQKRLPVKIVSRTLTTEEIEASLQPRAGK